VFGGLSPPNKAPSPSKCKRKAPRRNTNLPHIENFLATVLLKPLVNLLYTVEFVYNGFVLKVDSPITLHFLRSWWNLLHAFQFAYALYRTFFHRSGFLSSFALSLKTEFALKFQSGMFAASLAPAPYAYDVVAITIKQGVFAQVIRSTARRYFQGQQNGLAWKCIYPKKKPTENARNYGNVTKRTSELRESAITSKERSHCHLIFGRMYERL